MKLTITKNSILPALARCAAIASSKSTLPILCGVLLTFTENGVRIFATDLETGYETVVTPTENDITGTYFSTCINAKKLHECIKAIPVTDIDIEIDAAGHTLTITGGSISFTLSGLDADEFPTPPTVQGAEIAINAPALVAVLSSVAYAQCKDADKFNLNGCNLKLEDNLEGEIFISAAATDGHRLAFDTRPLDGFTAEIPAELLKGVIIPMKGVAEICKIATPGDIVAKISGGNLCLATDNEKIYFRLIDGDFPDYNRVIPAPEDLQHRIEIKRQALIDSLERCRIITDKESRGVRIRTDNGSVIISNKLDNIGATVQDTITAAVPDEELRLHININYLLETLHNLDCGMVEIQMKNEESPLLFNPLGTCEPLAVLMPMRA